MRIAREHGVTSGLSLDYIYRNRPSGRLRVGRLLDRLYLSHRSWQAIRIRKTHLQELLEWAIRLQIERRGEAFVLDVAAGPAEYLRNVLARLPIDKVEAICWDLDEDCLEQAQEAACAMQLPNVLCVRADAMEPHSYSRLPRQPNVVVASGFYDWMGRDALVRRSMELISRALPEGGCFVFTIQTGHSNLRVANDLFRGFDGQPLEMTTRPADLATRWARDAGFELLTSRRDEWGHYMVALAEKRRQPSAGPRGDRDGI
ncbi:MAG TPA: class I SAM-dependent methyltransferase family protein [Phycisphaerae bacterium]|nr:class I SAM-dependent methyltransferase family protein [Phycisphaerae bacterium]